MKLSLWLPVMMKNKIILPAAFACSVLIQQANAADINTNTARMQAMDKITGKVSEIDVPVNGLANFGTFSILVRKCVTKSPEETPENTAFVDIVDNYQTENPVNIFKGWMFSSTPALNAVEHPIYDIWLLKCYNSDAAKHKVLSEEQLALRDTLPIVRQDPIKVSTSIGDSEEDNDTKPTAEMTQETSSAEDENNKEVVELNIDSIAAAPEIKTENDEDFVSEGEEESISTEENTETPSDNQENPQPEPSPQPADDIN